MRGQRNLGRNEPFRKSCNYGLSAVIPRHERPCPTVRERRFGVRQAERRFHAHAAQTRSESALLEWRATRAMGFCRTRG